LGGCGDESPPVVNRVASPSRSPPRGLRGGSTGSCAGPLVALNEGASPFGQGHPGGPNCDRGSSAHPSARRAGKLSHSGGNVKSLGGLRRRCALLWTRGGGWGCSEWLARQWDGRFATWVGMMGGVSGIGSRRAGCADFAAAPPPAPLRCLAARRPPHPYLHFPLRFLKGVERWSLAGF